MHTYNNISIILYYTDLIIISIREHPFNQGYCNENLIIGAASAGNDVYFRTSIIIHLPMLFQNPIYMRSKGLITGKRVFMMEAYSFSS